MDTDRLLYASRILLTLACFALSTERVYAKDRVVVTYENGDAIVDYSGLVNSGTEVIGSFYYKCADQIQNLTQTSFCESEGASTSSGPVANHTIRIEEKGLFYFELRVKPDPVTGQQLPTLIGWQQFIVNLYEPDIELRAAIETHAPVYSFFGDEKYFPTSIDKIYGQPLSNYTIDYHNLSDETLATIRSGANLIDDSAASYMKGNGHLASALTLKKEHATKPNLNKDDFPVYWFADKISDNKVRITYFSLFSFDEKVPEYVQLNRVGSLLGEHAIDRESVSITFEQTAGNWTPTEIIYAAHTSDQVMEFVGCETDSSCSSSKRGDESVRWRNGATKIKWDSASKRKNRPVVYVAHGSHAHFPARGFYRVIRPLADSPVGLILVTGEPAGALRVTDEDFKPPTLVQLDLNKPEHAALTFSGTVIEGAGTRHRQFPFVRYPTQRWAASLGNDFEKCINDSERNCAQYIAQSECYGIGGLRNADGISFSDRDNDGVQDTRDGFPDDPSETTDINNDGMGDNANPPRGFVAISGQVTDSFGDPVAGAFIRLDMHQKQFDKAIALQTQTDRDGVYRLPIDLVNLPDTFALTIISETELSSVLFRRNNSNTSDIIADIRMKECDRSIVQIERFPRLHHAGDDIFEGQVNSEFQRETEGQQFNYEFNLPADINQYDNFNISFYIKGVDGNNSNFIINNNAVSITGIEGSGEFLVIDYEGKVAEQLLAGQVNQLTINAGYRALFGDFDDFEFVNPVLRLY